MIKLLSYLSVILGLAVFILFSSYDDAQNKITALETEKNALIINNERLVKNEMELRKQKSEVKKAVETEKLNFDWSFNLSDSPVRKRLSDNCLSCKR